MCKKIRLHVYSQLVQNFICTCIANECNKIIYTSCNESNVHIHIVYSSLVAIGTYFIINIQPTQPKVCLNSEQYIKYMSP